jgi:hypothetical protein
VGDTGGAVRGGDRGGARGEGGADFLEGALGHRVGHGDRVQLVDRDDGEIIVVGLHERALVQEELAGAAGDRRADLGVAEQQLGVGHRRLLGLHLRPGRLGLGRILHIFLLRDGGLVVQPLVTVKVGLRLRGHGPGVGEVGARAAQAVLERPAVELHQQVAGLHVVALAEMHLGDDAVDLRLDGDVAQGLHRADGLNPARHVLLHGDGGLDGHGGSAARLGGGGAAATGGE